MFLNRGVHFGLVCGFSFNYSWSCCFSHVLVGSASAAQDQMLWKKIPTLSHHHKRPMSFPGEGPANPTGNSTNRIPVSLALLLFLYLYHLSIFASFKIHVGISKKFLGYLGKVHREAKPAWVQWNLFLKRKS